MIGQLGATTLIGGGQLHAIGACVERGVGSLNLDA